MTIQVWLERAVADAERRGLAELKPLLESLARTTESLRRADEELRLAEEAPRSGDREKR